MRPVGTNAFLLGISVCVISCMNGSGYIKPINESKAAESAAPVNENTGQAYKEIFGAIERSGHARVIVALKTEQAKELTPSVIQTVRDKLLRQLSGYHYKLLRQYSTLPLLTLEVDKQSFEFLISSPLVNSIHMDSQKHKIKGD